MGNPDFYIASISIRGFRGIGELELSLDPDAPTLLIGPNNAGKSTLLDAMGMCLGSAKFSRYVPGDADFWREAGGRVVDDFVIQVRFKAGADGSLPPVKGGVGDPVEVHGIQCVAGREDATLARQLIDEQGAPIVLSIGTPISKGKQDSYKGLGLTGRRYARVQDIQKWLPLVWHIDSQSLFLSLYEWKSGPLQRLLEMYKADLFKSKWETKSGQVMPDALVKAHKFLRAQALASPFWVDSLAKTMERNFQEYLGRRSGFSMVPGLNPIEEWIQSELQILVAPGPNLAPVDSRRLGDGWQSLIRLAAMEAVAELGEAGRKTFVLAEEPETYLHPHLRRRLRRSLSRLQSSGYQVAVATHAPELISFRERQHIVRLTMTTEGARAREYSTASASQALRDEEKLNERGNHEIVFANVVVLAEGKDDVCALRMGLEKTGLDCDTDSVSIVDCGGVGNLPDYARVCSQLQIPWIAVHDRDLDESGMPKQPTEVAHSALEAIKTSRDGVLTWNNDLEDAIGLRAMGASGKASPLWIDRNHGSREWQTLKGDATITEYIAVIDAVRRGISQALGSS